MIVGETQWVQKRKRGKARQREGVECHGIGRSDEMWQWAHWLAGWLLLYTPITQSPCPPRHFNLIPPTQGDESAAQQGPARKMQESGMEPNHKILFPALCFHLCGWVFNFITKMATLPLITFCLLCPVCVDAVWMNDCPGPRPFFPLFELHVQYMCVYMPACAVYTHSTTFDWISQRESFQPRPSSTGHGQHYRSWTAPFPLYVQTY